MPSSHPETIRIGTRSSKLALTQANLVKDALLSHYPNLNITLVPIRTSGDIILDKPLYDIGGKGLFLKEIEDALLEKKIDIAVHSLKDVPGHLDERFSLACTLQREGAEDILVSRTHKTIASLPKNATIGTSSPRRAAQLKHAHPDITIVPIRGNIQTRLGKLEIQQLDAVILAYAGIERLDIYNPSTMHKIPKEQMLPAVGQGAIAVETLSTNTALNTLLGKLHDEKTGICTHAERLFLYHFETGSCKTPIAAHAKFDSHERISFSGLIASPNGKRLLKKTILTTKEALTNDVTDMIRSFKAEAGDHFFDE